VGAPPHRRVVIGGRIRVCGCREGEGGRPTIGGSTTDRGRGGNLPGGGA
jgi:hypothetical protein